jgi:hypothetical protein
VGAVLAGPGLAARRRLRAAGADGADLPGWRLVLIGSGAVWATCVMLSPVPYSLPNNLFWLLAGLVAAPWLFPREGGAAATADAPEPAPAPHR